MSNPLPSDPTDSIVREPPLGLDDLQQRYRVLAKLGSGGMADVFLARQIGVESFSRFAVIKRMRAQPDAQEENTRMFFNEARVVASLNHPHIVKVFDLGWVNKDISMAMEYLDGESLHYLHADAKHREEHIPLPIILKMIAEAAEALNYAHSALGSDGKPLKLIHRDVGLQNLLLTRSGYLKIIDFGVAKSSAQADVTTPGLVKGKIRYFAPETLTRKDVDGRADLYALGLVLFELVTLDQAHPFPADATLAQ
ncbi:MAG: serine/threonine-protein kinase, partial [Myxococcota bacterium]